MPEELDSLIYDDDHADARLAIRNLPPVCSILYGYGHFLNLIHNLFIIRMRYLALADDIISCNANNNNVLCLHYRKRTRHLGIILHAPSLYRFH